MRAESISLLDGLNFAFWHNPDLRLIDDLGLPTAPLPTFGVERRLALAAIIASKLATIAGSVVMATRRIRAAASPSHARPEH
jgi:hypothetical protein